MLAVQAVVVGIFVCHLGFATQGCEVLLKKWGKTVTLGAEQMTPAGQPNARPTGVRAINHTFLDEPQGLPVLIVAINETEQQAVARFLQSMLEEPALVQAMGWPSPSSTPKTNGVIFRSSFTMPSQDSTDFRFYQSWNRVPIYGTNISVEMDVSDTGMLSAYRCMNLTCYLSNPGDISGKPAIDSEQSCEAVRKAANYRAGAKLQTPFRTFFSVDADPPKVWYYYYSGGPSKPAGWHLAYIHQDIKVMPVGDDIFPAEVRDFVVDAHSGALVESLPRG